MGLLDHILGDEGELVKATVNFYGDQYETGSDEVSCRIRNITLLDRNVNKETLDAGNAIVWFGPEVAVQEGSIIKINDEYWRVNQLIQARRMTGPVLFIKCLVKKHRIAEVS